MTFSFHPAAGMIFTFHVDIPRLNLEDVVQFFQFFLNIRTSIIFTFNRSGEHSHLKRVSAYRQAGAFRYDRLFYGWSYALFKRQLRSRFKA